MMAAGQSDTSSGNYLQRNKTPLLVLLLFTVCVVSIQCNTLVYNFTMILFPTRIPSDDAADTGQLALFVDEHAKSQMAEITLTEDELNLFMWKAQLETLITVVPLGTVVLLYPAILLNNHFGFRRVLCVNVLFSALVSCALPFTISSKLYGLCIVLRIFQGCSLVAFMPLLGKTIQYLGDSAKTYVATFVFSYTQIGGLITFPLAGLLVSHGAAVATTHLVVAMISAVVLALFVLFHQLPGTQTALRRHELYRIFFGNNCLVDANQKQDANLQLRQVPYISMYQDVRLWTSFFSAFAYFSALQLQLQYGPSYLNQVLELSPLSTGLLTAAPSLAALLIAVASSVLFGRLTCIPFGHRIRLFNSLGSVLPATLFISQLFLHPTKSAYTISILYITGSSLLGFAYSGVFRFLSSYSGRFHVFIIANLFVVNLAAMFLTSLFNALITINNHISEWHADFLVHSILLLISNLILLFSPLQDEPAVWAKEGYEDTSRLPNRPDPVAQFPL